MIAVTDTSPLNYLIQIDEVHLLPALFQIILMPQAVFAELLHDRTPPRVREWLSTRPDWLQLSKAVSISSPSLSFLGPGEREAIQIAQEQDIPAVLVDEMAGRKIAEGLQLQVYGTLGILERGARIGLIDFRQSLRKLEKTNFRLSSHLKAILLARNP